MSRTGIAIAGLRCPGRHGAYRGERERTRTFLVDLDLDGASGPSDSDRAAEAARRAVAGRSHALLEGVADDVAHAILDALPSLSAVRVRVAKPDPPGLGATLEAVSLTRAHSPRP